MTLGEFCILFKVCKICKESKSIHAFSRKGGRQSAKNVRRSYCISCKDRRKEVILSNEQKLSYDLVILENEMIKVRVQIKKNKRITSYVNKQKAEILVQQGAAGIISKNVILLFYTKSIIRKMVLERDQFTCHYCGKFGDTIDHKIPKMKNGVSTLENCVCACYSCNQKKGITDYNFFITTNFPTQNS